MAEDPVYEHIRAAIAAGELHPNERLVEADLTERFGASRAAVRTALVRLEQEGVVEHTRNKGARVRLVAQSEAIEIYEARAVLEGLAARKAAHAASDEDLAELQAILDRLAAALEARDLAGASNRNAELHEAILRISGHATAHRLIGGLNGHLVRFHYRTILQPERPAKSFEEHKAIVDAIAERNAERAEQLMRSHLQLVIDTLSLPIPSAAV